MYDSGGWLHFVHTGRGHDPVAEGAARRSRSSPASWYPPTACLGTTESVTPTQVHREENAVATSPVAITTRPVHPRARRLIERLFGRTGASGGCWCMWPRLPGPVYRRQRGETNRESFRALLRAGQIHAVLAFEGREPVGWCSFGPRGSFPRINARRELASDYDAGHRRRHHDLDARARVHRLHPRSRFRRAAGCVGGRRPSVVQVRTHDITPSQLGPLVIAIIREHAAALEAGAHHHRRRPSSRADSPGSSPRREE